MLACTAMKSGIKKNLKDGIKCTNKEQEASQIPASLLSTKLESEEFFIL